LDQDIATVLAQHLAADRQAEAGAAGALRADKGLEDLA
jgi:hypothetical protein